jgi:hypothetical protein
MKTIVIKTALKLFAEALLFAAIITIVILILGHRKGWNSIAYSDAFFIAGGFMIIAGGISRLASSGDWNSSILTSGEAFRKMSASERANAIIQANTSLRLAILGGLAGLILILIAAYAAGMLF